jgi:hypothetical protein
MKSSVRSSLLMAATVARNAWACVSLFLLSAFASSPTLHCFAVVDRVICIPAVIVLCTMLSRLPRKSSLYAAMLHRIGQVKMGTRLTNGL